METILHLIKWHLLSETNKFIFLEEGDVAEIKLDKITIFDLDGNLVDRPVIKSKIKAGQS